MLPGEEAGDEDDAAKNEGSDNEDSDDDSDGRSGSTSLSGCSSTGTPTSLIAFAVLLLLALLARRAPARVPSQRATAALVKFVRTAVAVGVVVTGTLSVGCAHAVRIESSPGAEIFVNGKSVGTSPAIYSETTGSSDTQVSARLHGREKTVNVQRTNVDMAPIGAGAGIGAATCGTGLAVTVVAGFIFLPCALVTGAA